VCGNLNPNGLLPPLMGQSGMPGQGGPGQARVSS